MIYYRKFIWWLMIFGVFLGCMGPSDHKVRKQKWIHELLDVKIYLGESREFVIKRMKRQGFIEVENTESGALNENEFIHYFDKERSGYTIQISNRAMLIFDRWYDEVTDIHVDLKEVNLYELDRLFIKGGLVLIDERYLSQNNSVYEKDMISIRYDTPHKSIFDSFSIFPISASVMFDAQENRDNISFLRIWISDGNFRYF
ncbi:hypothetical protein PVA45_06025 [Entomospira entomophila]|uniref:Lipoprotein n=1 Tax=Entomospira entomophila TaxID=2719988 RepID=A0A968KU42_9SPIO|nr:hypothetical protein [Entomospira entomophilus]NIZ41056.1 hypothetical protein [Entomospira entomophilus]WDI35265.1 hypothetical protein PVA45_06025 [Entomospira entomophilus]